MYVGGYHAYIATMFGHHQTATFWSDEMSTGTVISLLSFQDTIWLLYFHSLFYRFSKCLLSAPFRSIFLLYTMLGTIFILSATP